MIIPDALPVPSLVCAPNGVLVVVCAVTSIATIDGSTCSEIDETSDVDVRWFVVTVVVASFAEALSFTVSFWLTNTFFPIISAP